MQIKTSELIGSALDWVVAKCEGFVPAITTVAEQAEHFRNVVQFDGSKPPQEAINAVISGLKPRIYRNADKLTPIPKYSTDWSEGGPIIEREGIDLWSKAFSGEPMTWRAQLGNEMHGPTPLIAAMRCYVASRLGNEVNIPDELTS